MMPAMTHAAPVLILGGGVSGLALAWRLAERGVAAQVLEASDAAGGLAGTVRIGAYHLDYGPHSFFTEDEEVRKTVLSLFDPPLHAIPRTVKFRYQNRLLDYPLTPAGVLLQMGFRNGLRAAASFFKAKVIPGRMTVAEDDSSVEEWAREHFGDYLYRTFFKPYTEQFWHIPASELSARTIPSHTRMGFLQTLRHLVRRRLPQQFSLIDREKLPTYYPQTGYGEIAARMAEKAVMEGAAINLRTLVQRVERLADGSWQVEAIQDGREQIWHAASVVSTLPLPVLIKILRPVPPQEVLDAAARLDFRPFVFLGMVTEKQNVLPASYMYVLNRPYNRVTEMNQFSPATSPAGENIIAVEIPCLRSSPVWNASKEELFEMCIGSLTQDGILSPGDVKSLLLVKAAYAYPVYRKNYAAFLARVLDYVRAQPGLETLGRSGEFMYMDADKCIRRAFDRADQWQPSPCAAI